MAKLNTTFFCTACGGESPKWVGKCPHCNQWNTLQEEKKVQAKSVNRYSMTVNSNKVENLSEVATKNFVRIDTLLDEFNRVLGGGLVPGSVVLISGDPGIGKSTLLLQAMANISTQKKVLYISGEESSQQIALRAKRLNINKDIRVYGEISLQKIIESINNEKSEVVVIDSIQTIFNEELTSSPGSVSQVKDCAAQLNRLAKEKDITMIIVGHISKDGDVAGPKALEHIVDTVLYFEGDSKSSYRMIRAFKNRFGSSSEVGIFSMTGQGLIPVSDPSGIFLSHGKTSPGTCVFAACDGTRPLLIEVQALVDESPLPNPIRRSIGLDLNRLNMLVAIVHKYLSIPIYNNNIFVNLIGGMKSVDPAIDIPAFIAILSSHFNKPLSTGITAMGEIGLTGDLYPPTQLEERVKESVRLGFNKIITAEIKDKSWLKNYQVELVECKDINTLITAIKA